MSEISRVKDDVLVIFSAHKLFDKMPKRDSSYKNAFNALIDVPFLLFLALY